MKNQKNSKGFTLVEVLIAVSILAIAIIPLLANFVTSSRVNVKSKRTLNATAVAQNIMEGISAFGVESAIVQLEDQTASPVKLRFMPEGMDVGNWGRAAFSTTTLPVTDSATGMPVVDLVTGANIMVTVPQYYPDRYQDDDGTNEIAMDAKESTMFSDEHHGTVTSTMKYAYEKAERDGTRKVYFKEDASHAYMFWMENVSYGNQKYDVLLTMDANAYRKDEEEDLFDTTQDVSHRSREEIKNKMSDSADPDGFGKNRNYNSLNLAKITSSIGTNVVSDDAVEDRYYTEPTNALSAGVLEIKKNCIPSATSEMIQERMERTIDITICKEANPLDSSKPFWIVKVKYIYHLTDTSLLNSGSDPADATFSKGEEIVYRSSQYPPRNLFFYYLPNYAPTDAGGSVADRINIRNEGGEEISGGSSYLGTDMNVYIVRMCDANILESPGSDATDLQNSEDRYRVDINLEEQTGSGGIRTSIYTNTGYNLRDDTAVSGMGNYYWNGMYETHPERMGIRTLSGAWDYPDVKIINGEDYIYRVTVQVFRAGSGFQKASRIAKFSGSSN